MPAILLLAKTAKLELREGAKKLQAKRAKRDRQIAARFDEPPIPANYCGYMDRLGDLILELKYQGRPLRWRDTEALEALRAMLQERGMKLTLKAMSHIWAEYWRAMDGRKTVEEMHETRLVDVVAKLREPDEGKQPDKQGEPLTELQRGILKALDGRALKTEALAKEVCGGEDRRLYKPGGLRELRAAGRVAHKHGVGHYRPDSPPAE